jgi:hypothetical protein
MKHTALTLALALVAAPAIAFGQGTAAQPGHVPPPGAPVAPDAFKPLPEIKGVVSWKTLAQVEQVKVKDRVVPQFSEGILKLDATEVRLQGFMMPLEMGDKQKHFVLTAMPQTCSFCLPGGPDSLVEVRAKTPVKYTFEPVVLTGKLTVLKDDPNGLYYRLTDAVPAPAK